MYSSPQRSRARHSQEVKSAANSQKLSCVQIRDSPVIHPALSPVEKIVTAPRPCRRVGVVARRSGFDKQVNGMFVPPINKRDRSPAMEIIEASALKRKASRRQVTHFRREVDLAIKPGLDCVLVGRNHIHQVSREERANVIGDQLISKRYCGWRARFGKKRKRG